MAQLLSAIPVDTAVTTWTIVEHMVGKDRTLELGAKKSRHLCERMLKTAEREGFTRRMPVKAVSSVPATLSNKSDKAVHKELLWTITPDGIAFLTRYNRLKNYVPRESNRSANYKKLEANRRRVERFYMVGLGTPRT